jgi:hypothetical protein
MSKMKIRAYTVSDVFTLVDLLASITGTAGDSLKSLLKSGGNISDEEAHDRGVELVLLILNKSYLGAKDKLIQWFASLTEMTVDEFLKQPPDTVLDVIDEIVNRKESKDFFSRAFARFNKTNNL